MSGIENLRPTALVTGVGRQVGIGAAIARELAAQGWGLVLTYWQAYDARMPWGEQPDDVAALVSELAAAGATVQAVQADFQDPAGVATLMAELSNVQLSGLVACHCESVDSGIMDTSLESFDAHFAVNARANWQLLRAFAQQIPDGGGAAVALTSDHVAFNLPYGASKGALDRIYLAAARELAPLGISANVVNPGPIDTGWMDEETRAACIAHQPTGRLGTPADVAPTVAFLLSQAGRWVNGQLLKVDGGFSA
ncbi:MAG: SDR family oxidoreductase [Acidobacteria bacterium]|nr:SDR family oxidoreductase [Acidobacteriota bacterium]